MKYKITAAIKTESFSTDHGAFDKYALQLTDESGTAVQCYINQKNTSPAPQAGEELNGTIEADNRGGMKFKKESGYGAGGGRSYGKPLEERWEMARENALTNAVNRAIALSQNMSAEEAKEALKPSNIVMAAYHFARFSMGEWNPIADKVAEKKHVEETPVQAAERVFEQLAEDVDPSEVPF